MINSLANYRSIKFPIPMRGNEVWRTGKEERWKERFPIPMRGNESYQVSHPPTDPQVPNPHEG